MPQRFDRRRVAEVAAGFSWNPGVGVTDLGGAAFRWRELNAKTAGDQFQATVSRQPTTLSAFGATQFFFGEEDVDARVITSGNVQAGWTGATYLGMWHRWPGVGIAGSLPSGTTTLFSHTTASTGLRRWSLTHFTGNVYSLTLSADGTATQNNTWDAAADYPFAGGSPLNPWRRLEWLFTPSVGVAMFVDFVLRAPLTNNINLASLNDPSVPLAIMSSTAAGQRQNDGEVGAIDYCNGHPSLLNRIRLANASNPTGVRLAA